MPLENPTFLDDLNENWPLNADFAGEGAAHDRNTKRALKASVFGSATAAGFKVNNQTVFNVDQSGNSYFRRIGSGAPTFTLRAQDNTELLQLAHSGTQAFFRNLVNSQGVFIQGRDGSGTTVTTAAFDPLAGVTLYYAGREALEAVNQGIEITGADGVNTQFAMKRGAVGVADLFHIQASNSLELRNRINGTVELTTNNGAERILIGGAGNDTVLSRNNIRRIGTVGDNVVRFDGATGPVQVELYDANAGNTRAKLLTTTASAVLQAETGHIVQVLTNSGGSKAATFNESSDNIGVVLHSGGVERAQTVTARVDGVGLELRDYLDNWLPGGLNVMPVIVMNASRTALREEAGRAYRVTATSTLTLPSLMDGWTTTARVAGGSGLTLSEGAGVTLNWYTGGTILTGDRTVAPGGWITITYQGNTIVEITGSGIA